MPSRDQHFDLDSFTCWHQKLSQHGFSNTTLVTAAPVCSSAPLTWQLVVLVESAHLIFMTKLRFALLIHRCESKRYSALWPQSHWLRSGPALPIGLQDQLSTVVRAGDVIVQNAIFWLAAGFHADWTRRIPLAPPPRQLYSERAEWYSSVLFRVRQWVRGEPDRQYFPGTVTLRPHHGSTSSAPVQAITCR